MNYKLLPFLLLLFSCHCFAAQLEYSEMVSLNQGLPSNVVHQMMQDDEGYLWLATENGLCRYDGKSFLKFNTPYTGFPYYIDPNIGAMHLDRRHNILWLRTASNNNLAFSISSLYFLGYTYSTEKGMAFRSWAETFRGMMLYDHQNGARLVRGRSNDPMAIDKNGHKENATRLHGIDFTRSNGRLTNNNVLLAQEDSLHNIWIVTAKGITAITPNGRIHKTFVHLGIVMAILNNNHLYLISEGGRFIDISTQQAMNAMNSKGTIRPVRSVLIGKETVDRLRNSNMSVVHNGDWVLFAPHGTCTIPLAKGTPEWPADIQIDGGRIMEGNTNYIAACANDGYAVILYPDGNRRRIQLLRPGHNDVGVQHKAKIAFGGDQLLYFATQGDGLVSYNPKNGEMMRYTSTDNQPLIPADKLNNIMITNDGMLWVMCERVGIVRLRINNMWKAEFYPGDTIPEYMKDLEVRQLLHQDSTHLAVCTRSDLWYGFDIKTRHFAPRTNFGASIQACLRDNKGYLWFGTRGKGIFYGKGRGIDNYTQNTAYSGQIRNIWQDVRGRIWVITSDNGVFCDKQHYLYDDVNTARVIDSYYSPDTGRLLIITAGGNFICDTHDETITPENIHLLTYLEKEDEESSRIPMPIAACGVFERSGKLWLGSHQYGLLVCSVDGQGRCTIDKKITTNDGLINNNVQCIVEDHVGYMWVGTEQGLSRISIAEYNATSIMMSYDVFSSYFNCGICTRDGEIVMGTNAGITIINPDTYMQSSLANSHLTISRIEVDEESIIDEAPASCISYDGSKLVLRHDMKKLRISYADTHFSTADLVFYQYRMDGIDTDWHSITKDTHSSYTTLPPGKYSFRVRVMMASGKWSEEKYLDIVVENPWYNSWYSWTILLAILALINAAIILRYSHHRKSPK